MIKSKKFRNNRMKRLSTMVDPMIAPSARKRGFAIGRIISHWHEIVGDISTWCHPADISFPRDSLTNGTLKLQIISGRGPQAQSLSAVIIDRVNANFGYQAVSRISLMQTLTDPKANEISVIINKSVKETDIWTLDDKLKDVKSPGLRAALRRLGGLTIVNVEAPDVEKN